MSRLEPITSLQDAIEEPHEENPHRSRLVLLQVVVALAFLALVVQLWHLQIIEGGQYRDQADNNRFRQMPVEAPRGVIYDRNRVMLARNRPGYVVGIVPADLPLEPEPVYRRLAVALGTSSAQIRRAVEAHLADRFSLITLKSNVSEDVAFIVEERHRELPGVHVVVQPVREYLDGPLNAHVIGYTGPLSPEQYQRLKDDPTGRYALADRTGQIGIEGSFEADLRGRPGQREMEVDAGGREVRLLVIDEPEPGHNLILSIDAELQRTIGDLLGAGLARYENAAAVAIEPSTGRVLALVSLPSYDNNLFSRGITDEEYGALTHDERKPLLDGAIGSAYPPGAVFEAITAAGALQERVVTAGAKVDCPGHLIVPNRLDPTLGTRFGDGVAHGQQDVVSALANQCGVFFFLAGGGDPDGKTDGLGTDGLLRYARLFGLGAPTGIDLDGEATGFLGTPDWKKQTQGENWYKGDTYTTAVGLDYVLATPLQMANAFAAIANGGTLYRPNVVMQVTDDAGNVLRSYDPEPLRPLGVAPEHLAAIRAGLRAATQSGKTDSGTTYVGVARRAASPDVSVAGTVSSVEFAPPSGQGEPLTHGWFVGFAPADNPRIALAIFLKRGSGSEDAANLARVIFSRYLGSR